MSDISTVCAFSSDNIPEVARLVRGLYPKSPIILFADDDRHLEAKNLPNQGLLKAQEAYDLLKENVSLISPEFYNIEPSKDASDWNDLMRLKGSEYVKVIIGEKLPRLNSR